MSDWRRTRLGDFAPFSYGKALPERLRVAGNIPVYGSNGIVGQHNERLIDGPMVVIGRKGSVGEVHFAPHGGWPIDTTFYVTTGPQRDARFTYYLLKYLDMRHMSSDSAVPGLNRDAAYRRELLLPPLSEQRAIAEVLGALDDKTEANRRMATICSELAAALFARAETREVVVADVADVLLGQSPPGSTYNDTATGLPFYQGIRDFGFRHPAVRVWCSKPTRLAERGDVLVSVRAPVGTVNVATERCAIGRGVAALRARSSPSLLYQALTADPGKWTPYQSEGTVFGAITGQQLRSILVRWPVDSNARKLELLLSHVDSVLESAERESLSLTVLRDALLPKLLSGELRVRTAEALVGEAVSGPHPRE